MANVFDSENSYVVNNNIGLGGKNLATAKLHVGASNGKSSTAPLKFDPGISLTNPENGAVEYDGSHLYITISGVRYQLDQQSGGGGIAWGSIQGTLSNQTDLQNALNLKLNLTGGTLSGILSLGGNKITNLATPTLSTDAATKGYVDSIPAAAVWGNITGTLSNQTDLESALNAKEPTIIAGTTSQYYRGDKTFQILNTSVVTEGSNLYFTNARVQSNTLDSLAAPLGSLSLNSQNVVNLLDPVNPQDAATKNYVDGKFPVSVVNGGTGVSSAFSSGSIVFSNGSSLAQDNANLFWDSTNHLLGIGTNSPESGIDLANNDMVARGSSTWNPTLFIAASQGTLTSPTIITGGRTIGGIVFDIYNGSQFSYSANIVARTPTGATFSTSSTPLNMSIGVNLRRQSNSALLDSIFIGSQKTINLWGGTAVSGNSNFTVTQPGTGINLPGLVTTNSTTSLVGTETLFTNDFKIGDTINVSGETSRIILTITDDTHLTVTSAFSTSTSNLTYQCSGSSALVVRGNGQIGIGISTPTSFLHLPAGTANATTSPLKFTAGTNLTTPESGAMEWDGTNLYITQTSGPTRQTIAYTGNIVDSLTAGTGIFVSGSTGNITITNVGVTSLTGTTNQVNVSASIGAVTLSLPQNINTSATPTFGGLSLNGQEVITSNLSNAFVVGPNGTTNPAFQVDASQATLISGVKIKGSSSGNNVGISVISSGANVALTLDALGSGTLGINTTSATSGLITLGNSTSLAGIAINGGATLTGKITNYNHIATSGQGVPSIYGYGRSTAQTAAVASVATYTNGASDGSFLISANVNVTTFSIGTFNVTVIYTDETNTSQTLKLNFSSLTGTIGIAIAASGPFEGIPAHIRCKASTSITIATSGTFTSLTYNVEGQITQLA